MKRIDHGRRHARRSPGTRLGAILPFWAIQAVWVLCAFSLWAAPSPNPVANEPDKPAFREIWAYLVRGEEAALTGSEPITDVCYFGVNLTKNGRIPGTVARPVMTMKDGSRPAVHLVVAELSNEALMHFSLDPEYGVMPLLVDDICRVSESFDGVQIDFEAVARDDAYYFAGFLKQLRIKLPAGKELSVALPARTRTVADAYDYTRIAPFVDRMVIMAYDEHWSTSSPGPVASLPWCSRVADYARSIVDSSKIVMGLPLYGRAWQDKKLAKALRFQNVQDLVAETNSTPSYAPELGAHFQYSESVVVSVYYDDERSILDKLKLYQSRGIQSVSFWRVGLGPPQLWGSIEQTDPEAAPVASGRDAPSSPAGSQASAR